MKTRRQTSIPLAAVRSSTTPIREYGHLRLLEEDFCNDVHDIALRRALSILQHDTWADLQIRMISQNHGQTILSRRVTQSYALIGSMAELFGRIGQYDPGTGSILMLPNSLSDPFLLELYLIWLYTFSITAVLARMTAFGRGLAYDIPRLIKYLEEFKRCSAEPDNDTPRATTEVEDALIQLLEDHSLT